MPFLILPPPQIIADNQEIPKQVLLQAQNYQKDLLKELNAIKETSKVTDGAYKGTKIFSWDQKYNGILMTSFIYQQGKAFKKEWMHTATLLRKEDCTHLGSIWNYNDKTIIPFPLQNSSEKISTIAGRSFKQVSPVKVDLEAKFSDKNVANLFNIVLQEEFSKRNVPLISNVGRFLCKADNLKDAKMEQINEYPARPHRIVNIKVTENQSKSSITEINYEMQINSAILGQKEKKIFEKKEKISFNPQKISEGIVEKILPSLDDLSRAEFKIIKRVGSWVYLNRGRAFGLTIGMRLVGPHNSTLHIIRYSFGSEFNAGSDVGVDNAIAFIRHESKESPLVNGDTLKLDPMVYPK